MLKLDGAITYHSDTESHHSQEECIHAHVLCHIIDGELKMQDIEGEKIYVKGDTFLIRKNYLVKCEKRPSNKGGRYQIIFVVLSPELLQDYLVSKDLPSFVNDTDNHPSVIVLQPKPAMQGLLESLLSYHTNNYQPGPALLRSKLNETI
ncbi:hypothetical protein A4H97_18190 [Niastella yeongjuensis]|uniref:ExsA-like N-terminal regulatory domain-containing protein n=1 Tax=Niastella yeongjuensis TaxID=354355 RepID=A0A1V9DXS1_9BACT|nr:hypothetical protein [Niastella yeongjuensis]OQP38652.1 hypothetical protein A4H97_18190 [Niastella yeongjuensis]SEO37971.1 hypothetical protein SAMN05660816_02765 [Niastella yeongjuensis]